MFFGVDLKLLVLGAGHIGGGGGATGIFGAPAQRVQTHNMAAGHANFQTQQAAMDANALSGASVSSVVDLVATGSLSTGAVKLAGDVLSSTSGRLLVSAGAVGIGTGLLDPADKLVVNGPLRLSDGGTKPQCDTNRRGMIWHEFGDLGTGDTVEVCVKLADESFSWRLAVNGGGAGGGGSLGGGGSGPLILGGGGEAVGGANGLARNFPVGSGERVNRGDVVTFVEGEVRRGYNVHFGRPAVFAQGGGSAGGGGAAFKRKVTLVPLDASTFVLVHGGGGAGQGAAQLGRVSGTSSFVGSARSPFGPPRLEAHAAVSLGDGRAFAIAYLDATKGNAGFVVVGEVVGEGVVGFGVPVQFAPEGASSVALEYLGGGRLVVAHNRSPAAADGGGGLRINAVISLGTYEGGKTVKFTKEPTELPGELDGFALAAMDAEGGTAGRFAIAYRNLRTKEAGVRLCAIVTDRPASLAQEESGGASETGGDSTEKAGPVERVSFGAEALLPTSGRVLTYLLITAVTPSRLVAAYADAREGNLCMVDYTGGVASVSQSQRFVAGKPLSLSISAFGFGGALVAYYTSNPWRAVVLRAEARGVGRGTGGSGSTVGKSAGAVVGLKATATSNSAAAAAAAGAKPGGGDVGSTHGALELSESIISPYYSTHTDIASLHGMTFLAVYYDGSNGDAGTCTVGSIGRGVGVAMTDAEEGQSVSVVFSGVSSGHEGLEVGTCYFATADGSLTSSSTRYPVGLAISNSELLLDKCS
ncbi:hypothetical protein NFJ02_39g98880 [Pycnococcus provasolii]